MNIDQRDKSISDNIVINQTYIKDKTGIGISFDVDFREVQVLKRKVQLYYVNGLTDGTNITELLKTLVKINDVEKNENKVWEIIENRLVNEQLDIITGMSEAIDQILAGLVVIFIDGVDQAFVIDVREYPGRTPEEPDTERVIRGSRDGFTENIVENTALMRRRIKDERLRNEMLQVGVRSKTEVCVSYIQDIADNDLVLVIKDKINSVTIDGITMAEKALEEFFFDEKWNPYPMVRYTERPDVAANHLLEGHVLVLVDTSPSIIILPTTYFDHLEHAEEYRQTPTIGTFIRWIRMLAVFASIFLLPVWLLFVNEPALLPKELSYIGLKEEGNISVSMQIIIALIGVEFLRMAAVHTPTPLATAMGLIAAVLIGEIAVEVGLFSPEVILYVAISTIGNYVTPSYELSVGNKIWTLFLIFATMFFGATGFMIGTVLSILYLVHLKSLRVPYLWPFIPFNPIAMLHVLLRIPVPYTNTRPSMVHPKNVYNQPVKEK